MCFRTHTYKRKHKHPKNTHKQIHAHTTPHHTTHTWLFTCMLLSCSLLNCLRASWCWACCCLLFISSCRFFSSSSFFICSSCSSRRSFSSLRRSFSFLLSRKLNNVCWNNVYFYTWNIKIPEKPAKSIYVFEIDTSHGSCKVITFQKLQIMFSLSETHFRQMLSNTNVWQK